MELFGISLPPWMSVLELPVLGRLALALVLGGAIGLERELSDKPAGLRTNALICIGAELITEVSIVMASTVAPHELIRADPARIAAQVVTGIGFIGAGTIIVLRGSVVGLTTAATLWVVAAIGMTVGVRAYVIAVGSTALVLFVLVVERWIERRGVEKTRVRFLTIRMTTAMPDRVPIEAALSEAAYDARLLGFERHEGASSFTYRVQIDDVALGRLLDRLGGMATVRSAQAK